MADKVGVFNRLGYSASGNATVEMEFMAGTTLGLNETFIDTQGLSGTREHHAERVRRGTRRVEGTLQFAPSAVELGTILPLILGAAASGTTFNLAETLPVAQWHAWRDGTLYKYADCKVDTATISASEGGPLTVNMSVIGVDETLPGGSFPALSIDLTTGPFVLSDAGDATVGGSTYPFSSFELSINNTLEVKYRNSETPTSINPTDREISVSLPFDLGSGSALYGSAVTGVSVSITLTNGATSLTILAPSVAAPRQPLPFGQRGLLDLPWRGIARKSGSGTPSLTVTLDSAP